MPLHMNGLLQWVGKKALKTMHRCLIQAQRNEYQLLIPGDPCTRKGFSEGGIDLSFGRGNFQINMYKMIRFLSGKLKKHTKLSKIVKISIFNN